MARRSRMKTAWAWSKRWFKRLAVMGIILFTANILLAIRPISFEDAMGLYWYDNWYEADDKEYLHLTANGTFDHCVQCKDEWVCYRGSFNVSRTKHNTYLDFGVAYPVLGTNVDQCLCNDNCGPPRHYNAGLSRWEILGIPVILGITTLDLYVQCLFHDSLEDVVPKEVLERDLYEDSWRRFVHGEPSRASRR